MRTMEQIREEIESGRAVLGIEFGSTRIKAVLIGEDKSPVASGSYEWEKITSGLMIWRRSGKGLQDAIRA